MGRITALSVFFSVVLLGCGKGLRHGAEESELLTVVYEVEPEFLSEGAGDHESEGDDTFAKLRKTAKEIMIEEGVTFPEGAVVFYGLPIAGVGLRNTQANHDLWQKYLDRELPGKWRVYEEHNSNE